MQKSTKVLIGRNQIEGVLGEGIQYEGLSLGDGPLAARQ